MGATNRAEVRIVVVRGHEPTSQDLATCPMDIARADCLCDALALARDGDAVGLFLTESVDASGCKTGPAALNVTHPGIAILLAGSDEVASELFHLCHPRAFLPPNVTADDVYRLLAEQTQLNIYPDYVVDGIGDAAARLLNDAYGAEAVVRAVRTRTSATTLREFTGVLSFCGSWGSGRLCVSADPAPLSALFSSIAGGDVVIGPTEHGDLCGELSNQILGYAKTFLATCGLELLCSVPAIITGADQKMSIGRGSATVLWELDTRFGSFLVELAFDSLVGNPMHPPQPELADEPDDFTFFA